MLATKGFGQMYMKKSDKRVNEAAIKVKDVDNAVNEFLKKLESTPKYSDGAEYDKPVKANSGVKLKVLYWGFDQNSHDYSLYKGAVTKLTKIIDSVQKKYLVNVKFETGSFKTNNEGELAFTIS